IVLAEQIQLRPAHTGYRLLRCARNGFHFDALLAQQGQKETSDLAARAKHQCARHADFRRARCSQKYPASAAMVEPTRMPMRCVMTASAPGANASEPMNRLIVKPMPHSRPRPASMFQSRFGGRRRPK